MAIGFSVAVADLLAGGLGFQAHLAVCGQHAAGERAVLALHLDKPRQHGTGAEFGGGAAEDARKQRIGQPVDGLAAKVALDQRGN